MACDFGTDRFLLNNGDGTFKDATKETIGIDTKKGMNADWGDYDNDGWLDVFVTNITDDYMREGNFLWRNNGLDDKGKLTFTDVARETGTYETGWGWGGKFLDYDDDGWLDLYVVNGWVSAGPRELRARHLPDDHPSQRRFRRRPQLAADGQQEPLRLREEKTVPQRGRHLPRGGGAPRARLDPRRPRHRGGRPRQRRPARPLRDQRQRRALSLPEHPGQGGSRGPHSATFLLEGRKSNRDAIGAQLRATAGGRTELRFVDGGNGFAAQSSRRVHFGLAAAAVIDRLEVRWPSGLRQTFANLPADRFYRLVEGEPDPKPFTPESRKK